MTANVIGKPAKSRRNHPHSPSVSNLIFRRRQIVGSLICGFAETQEMLDFCSEHNITSGVEIIPIAPTSRRENLLTFTSR